MGGVDLGVRQFHHTIGTLAVVDVTHDLVAFDDFVAVALGFLAEFGHRESSLGGCAKGLPEGRSGAVVLGARQPQ